MDRLPSGSSKLRIVAVGSSATRGFQIKQEDAWPEQLEILCREANWDASVTNRASHGLALPAFAERILHLEKNDPHDIYLLQLPIPARTYFGVNGSRRLREEAYQKDVILGWSEKSAHISPTRILLTGGSLDKSSPFHKYLESFFYPIIKRNNPEATYDDFLTYLKFWEANIRNSDLELISYAKEVVLVQHIMTLIAKPYLMFEWCGTRLRSRAERVEPFYPLIDWSVFVGQGHYTVIDYLKQHKGARYKDLLNDQYTHLNRAGNRVVAEEIVFPEIERLQKPSR